MGGDRDNLTAEERIRYELDGVSPQRQAMDRMLLNGVSRLVDLLANHWLVLLNGISALTLLGAVGAAYLAASGQREAANWIYQTYLLLCPQRPSHSFYLWGEKVALEQRVLAIYGATLVGGLVFAMRRRELRPLGWRIAILLSLPMLVDVLSQTFGMRDGDWFWRVTTGSLFGLTAAWWALPRIQSCLREMGVARE